MTSHEYARQRAAEFAQAARKAGFRAFVAEKGNYGFFTDAEGTKTVDFQVNGYFESSISGNYKTDKPRATGNGWRIADSIRDDAESIRQYFNSYPPHWAVGDANWVYTTLDHHLATYGNSSKYVEVK